MRPDDSVLIALGEVTYHASLLEHYLYVVVCELSEGERSDIVKSALKMTARERLVKTGRFLRARSLDGVDIERAAELLAGVAAALGDRNALLHAHWTDDATQLQKSSKGRVATRLERTVQDVREVARGLEEAANHVEWVLVQVMTSLGTLQLDSGRPQIPNWTDAPDEVQPSAGRTRRRDFVDRAYISVSATAVGSTEGP